jgi:hypothetical protein
MQSFTSIPFKTKSDFSQVNGIAKFSGAGIVLEFESKFLGLIGTGVKEVRLPLAEILDIKFQKGFLKRGSKIEIRAKNFATMTELPSKEGKLTLKLAPIDCDRAAAAVKKLNEELVDYAESLPPTHTSVGSLFEESEEESGDKVD